MLFRSPVRFLPPTAGSVPTRCPSPRPAPPPTLGQVSRGQWAGSGQVPANSRLASRWPSPGWTVLGGPGAGVGPGWTREGGGRAQPPGRRGSSQHRTEPAPVPAPGAARSAAEAGEPSCEPWPDSPFTGSHTPRRSAPGSWAGAERGRAGGGGEGCWCVCRERSADGWDYVVGMSYLEIYNEKVGATPGSVCHRQIGRASCRERVSSPV